MKKEPKENKDERLIREKKAKKLGRGRTGKPQLETQEHAWCLGSETPGQYWHSICQPAGWATAGFPSSPLPQFPPGFPMLLLLPESQPWPLWSCTHRRKRWWQELPTLQRLRKGCLSKGEAQPVLKLTQTSGWELTHPPAGAVGVLKTWGCPWLGRGLS